jgi:hypothetical protein
MNDELEAAHRLSSNHRPAIEASESCRCFYCLARFGPSEITEWLDEPSGGETACCPRCGIDSVLGSAQPVDLADAFMERMQTFWFG